VTGAGASKLDDAVVSSRRRTWEGGLVSPIRAPSSKRARG